MSAIITTNFRLENANNFRKAISDVSNSLYVFIGKSDKWGTTLADSSDTPPDTHDNLVEVNDVWQNMIAVKQITASDTINLTPRHNWDLTTSNVFVAWDDADANIWSEAFYCITEDFKVYKCIVSPGTKSTIKPFHTSAAVEEYADGYSWKYMYTVASVYQKFLTNNYLPVKQVLEEPEPGSADEGQWQVQQDAASYKGKIYRAVVTTGGTGYVEETPPSVTIYGDGTGATATAVVTGNTVTAINITNTGSNYNVAYAVIAAPVSGTTAVCRVILSPRGGHGSDATSELGAFLTAVAVSLRYDEAETEGAGDFIVNNSFRQLGIIKNPIDDGTGEIATDTTLTALKGLVLTGASNFVNGDYITGATSGAKAYIDYFNSDDGTIRYHQNDKTGYVAFQPGEGVTGFTGGSGNILSSGGFLDAELQRFTGEILFFENRLPITRTSAQIEDVKIVIEF